MVKLLCRRRAFSREDEKTVGSKWEATKEIANVRSNLQRTYNKIPQEDFHISDVFSKYLKSILRCLKKHFKVLWEIEFTLLLSIIMLVWLNRARSDRKMDKRHRKTRIVKFLQFAPVLKFGVLFRLGRCYFWPPSVCCNTFGMCKVAQAVLK